MLHLYYSAFLFHSNISVNCQNMLKKKAFEILDGSSFVHFAFLKKITSLKIFKE